MGTLTKIGITIIEVVLASMILTIIFISKDWNIPDWQRHLIIISFLLIYILFVIIMILKYKEE